MFTEPVTTNTLPSKILEVWLSIISSNSSSANKRLNKLKFFSSLKKLTKDAAIISPTPSISTKSLTVAFNRLSIVSLLSLPFNDLIIILAFDKPILSIPRP